MFLIQFFLSLGQKEDTLGLSRFFWSVIPSTVLDSQGKKIVQYNSGSKAVTGGTYFVTAGVQYEIGNYWAFNKNKPTTGFFRLTYARIGVNLYGLVLAPAQLGLGVHFDFNKRISLDAVLNGGLLLYTDDPLYPGFEFNYAIYPQIKVNINHFSIGLEYTYHRHEGGQIRLLHGYHYFGIAIGGTFGKKIN